MYLGEARVVCFPGGRSKVRDLHAEVVRHQQVLRLEVPMDDAVLHRVGKLVEMPVCHYFVVSVRKSKFDKFTS